MLAGFAAIVGPTGVGKSALALAVAGQLPAEIVNADALQAYRRLEIGTGKPTSEERERVPHHLLDILDPSERYSAGEFARRAGDAIESIRRRGRLPIVVGGSGLYFRALRDGLCSVPAIPREVRQELEANPSTEDLLVELRRVDPESAARCGPSDRRRILRALEVVRGTGRTLGQWWREDAGPLRPSSVIGLTLPRPLLYDRIARRVDSMVDAGWESEVQGLLAEGVKPEAPAFQAIGYRQWVSALAERQDRRETIAEIVRETRRYAKRQETWFRKERGITWLDSTERDDMSLVLEHLAGALVDRASRG